MENGPPPPPHGRVPRDPRLPDGPYDIFILPPHSAGAGFLLLPSLQPHRNSFLAGVGCTLVVVAFWSIALPALKQWMSTVVASGGVAVVLVIMGVGVAGWAYGKTQQENVRPSSESDSTGGPDSGAKPSTGGPQQSQAPPHSQGPQPNGFSTGFSPRPGPTFSAGARDSHYTGPKPTWQSANGGTAAAGWEKAREEMKKREEERKKKEEAEKKAKEAELKAKEIEQKAKEAAEKERWEKARVRERESREREAREKLRKEKEAKPASERSEKAEKSERAESEHTNPAATAAAAAAANTSKPYRKPTAQSFIDDEEIHSFRPYDTPSKRPAKASSQSSFYSEPSSYAASQSTARTTPPRSSQHGPYTTKDPDKIVIKAVYSFTDLFPKPGAQLVSGAGSVTDGLVLRITTEGLFIDDDVRSVPQREWDVKAWTMKLIEVWCPQFCALSASSGSASAATSRDNAPMSRKTLLIQRFHSGTASDSRVSSRAGPVAALTLAETTQVLACLVSTCKAHCSFPPSFPPTSTNTSTTSSSRYASSVTSTSTSSTTTSTTRTPTTTTHTNTVPLSSSTQQSGSHNNGKYHILRASIRDADNKRYVFVIDESEAWKVAVGLQRLRRGNLVRSLGVQGFMKGEGEKLVGGLGWV